MAKPLVFHLFSAMKNLILIRHAQAEPETFPKKDFDRNLDAEGINEAEKLAQFIVSQDAKPEIILCSPANRTMQTGQQIAECLSNLETIFKPVTKLYNAGLSILRDEILSYSGTERSIALVGHNPGISQVASYFSKSETFQLATASAVCISFDTDSWAEVRPASGHINWHFKP